MIYLLFYRSCECMLSIRNMSGLWISLCFGYSFLPCCYFSSCVMHMKKQSPHFLQVWGTDRKTACKSSRRREYNCLLSESQKFWLYTASFPKSWMIKFPCCEFGSSSVWLHTSILVEWLLFSEYATYVSRKYIILIQIWCWGRNLFTICPICVMYLFFL